MFYFFRYKTDGDKIFHGTTVNLVREDSLHLHLLFGANDILYWVQFDEDEINNTKSISKTVRLGMAYKFPVTLRLHILINRAF